MFRRLAMLLCLIAAPLQAAPIFLDDFDDGSAVGWSARYTTNGGSGLGDDAGRMVPFDVAESAVLADGVVSPALRLMVGKRVYTHDLDYVGVELDRVFEAPSPGTYTLSLDVMATPWVPYFMNHGGRFEARIGGELIASFTSGLIGLTVPEYQVDRTRTGAVRASLSGEAQLDAGLHTLTLFVGRHALTGSTPTQHIDNVRLDPTLEPEPVFFEAEPPTPVPVPPAGFLLAGGLAMLGISQRRRTRASSNP